MNPKIKRYILILIALCNFGFVKGENLQVSDTVTVRKIWDKEIHQAFTDLIRFNGAFYCSFREGKNHVGAENNGKVRILRSKDGNDWQSVALLELNGLDLRDPKLSITPDKRLMITLAGAVFENGLAKVLVPMSSFSDKSGRNFTLPVKVALDPAIKPSQDWIWRVTWHNNIGYGINYQLKENARDRSTLKKDAWVLYLMKTTDGKNFENISKLEVDDLPNESTIRFDKNGKMYVLIRREAGDKMGVMAESNSPYKEWNYTPTTFRLGGPNFVFLNNKKLLVGTRMFDPEASMGIYATDLGGNVIKTLKLPSGGDNSYPGMVVYKNKLWVSYYSSHEGKTSIYLAKIPLDSLLN